MKWKFWERTEQRDLNALLYGMDWAASNASGIRVTSTSALGLSAVYACVRLLSDTISTLPVDAFIRKDATREPSPIRPGWLDTPGAGWFGMTELLNQAMTSLLLTGNFYALTPRTAGEVLSLIPLDPATVVRDQDGTYRVSGEELGTNELLHIPGMLLPGQNVGCSPITYARETLGLAMAAQKFGAAFFGNGAWPGIAVKLPAGQTLSADGQKLLRASLEEMHKGSGNARKPTILVEGAELEVIKISAEDSQFIETRRFEVSDVARLFGVPPHLIGDSTGSTSWGSGLAEQNVAFAQHSLRPWVERIERAFTRLWLSEGGPSEGFIKLNMSAVLRGSTKDRYESYQIAIASGFLTINEARALEDLPPLSEEELARITPVRQAA